MIRQISGEVLSVGPVSAVILVAGFGIEVRMSSPETLVVGSTVHLSTHLTLKQDGLELYGFMDVADRDFFERMLGVSGVGPKTALSVLRRTSREALEGAISTRDLAYLTKVVGLGKKSAEKILIELADKIGSHAHAGEDGEVFDTLVALGYTEREARKALQTIPKELIGKGARLKAALSSK